MMFISFIGVMPIIDMVNASYQYKDNMTKIILFDYGLFP